MSRVIKSAFAVDQKNGGRTIRLRDVTAPATGLEPLTAGQSSPLQQAGKQIHYNEQQADLKVKREELSRLEKALEAEKTDWEAFKEEQLAQIRKHAETEYNRAAEEGYNRGYEDGLEQGTKACDESLAEARETIELAVKDYESKLAEAEPVILDIALKVAEKITGQSLENENGRWISLIKQALEEVREQEEVKLYVHPGRYDLTLRHKEELKAIALHSRELLIFPDGSLSSSGCLIETPYGQVDASVDSQLREMKRLLSEKLKEGDSHEH